MTLCSSTVRIVPIHNSRDFSYIGKIDSGHGGQTKDLDGDEEDGYDEGDRLSNWCFD